MKKLLLFLSLLFIMSLSVFADETFKCRKETYIYNYKYAVHRGEEYSEEFYFINNFMIYEYQIPQMDSLFFIKMKKVIITVFLGITGIITLIIWAMGYFHRQNMTSMSLQRQILKMSRK